MSYPDPSESDERSPDGGRRRATRPAWDAATYGVPDDMRRSRSSRGRRQADRAQPERAEPERAQADRTQADRTQEWTQADRAASDGSAGAYPTYAPYPAADAYPAPVEPYLAAPPEPVPLDRYPQAPSYRAEPYRYDPEPAVDARPSEAAAHDPKPYGGHPYDPGPYPGAAYDSGRRESSAYDPGPHDSPAYDAAPNHGYQATREAEQPYGPYGRDPYPGGVERDDPAPAPPTGRAGRNLPAAIGVGLLLGAVAVSALFLWRPAFFAVIAVAVGIGIWELVRAIRTAGANPPMAPLIVGGALMTGLAWWGQADALTFGLVVTVLAAMVWRLSDGVEGYAHDVVSATLVAVYVPFLGGFVALLAVPDDGDKRVLVTLALIVLSDTGGYVAGVLLGRHPMAPRVSPKKSWEGLGGSFVAAGAGGAVLLAVLFGVSLWWGALFGFAMAAAATLGDLGESMVKRDLGVKDMSNLLPGHGGLMDRLDSILVAAPAAYVLLLLLVPPL